MGFVEGIACIDRHADPERQAGKRFLFRVRVPGRRNAVKSKAFDAKPDGYAWARMKRAQFTLGEATTGVVPTRAVVDAYVETLRGARNETHVGEVERIGWKLAELAPDLASSDVGDVFLAWLKTAKTFDKYRTRALSNATRNRWLVHAKAVANFAVRKGHIRRSPLVDVDSLTVTKKLKATLRIDELHACLADTMRSDVHYLFNAVRTYTGLRTMEAAWLRAERIDRGGRIVEVAGLVGDNGRVLWKPKDGEERRVPLMRELSELLETAWRDGQIPETGFLFPDAMRSWSTKEHWLAMRAYVDRSMARVGHSQGRRLKPHSLRYTYATLRLANGDSLIDVRRALGHSEFETTEGYVGDDQGYAAAIVGWPRNEFCLRRPAAAIPADPLEHVRLRLRTGATAGELAAAAGMEPAELDAWLRQGPPAPVRQFLALTCGASVGAVSR